MNISFSEDGRSVVIIDQTLLPGQLRHITLRTREEHFDAIFKLRVRGAPAIGIFTAFCMSALAARYDEVDFESFLAHFREDADYLISSRPTAVNLSWAVARMESVLLSHSKCDTDAILSALRSEALAIQLEDAAMCLKISEHGLSLLKEGDSVITHCNAGPLATSSYGTALGPLFLAKERGMDIRVFADETRPLMQGSRLTAWELYRAGIKVTLICDNMAAGVMKKGWIQACFVGADRVAANGDFANKTGTFGLAVAAKHFGIPFYALCPTSTIDIKCKTGADINIELREPEEIKELFFSSPIAPKEVACYNPAFDVTDASLITGIITEMGILRPPYNISIAEAMQNRQKNIRK